MESQARAFLSEFRKEWIEGRFGDFKLLQSEKAKIGVWIASGERDGEEGVREEAREFSELSLNLLSNL
jgi:hypothetical protein